MKTLLIHVAAAFTGAVVIGIILMWSDHTVRSFADGKVSMGQFQSAGAIGQFLFIPVHIFFLALAMLIGGFSYTTDSESPIPFWLVMQAAGLWAVIIFSGLRIATRIWRKLRMG